jgi:hypothetical protein
MIEPDIGGEALLRPINKCVGAKLVEAFAAENSLPNWPWFSDALKLRFEPAVDETTATILPGFSRLDEIAHTLQSLSLDFGGVSQDQPGWLGYVEAREVANEACTSGVRKSKGMGVSTLLTATCRHRGRMLERKK